MPKTTLSAIASRYGSVTALNANFDAVEAAIENTLSRDGTSPNAMEAELDMNSNRIINLPDPISDSEPATKGWAESREGSAAADAASALASAVAAAASAASAAESAAEAQVGIADLSVTTAKLANGAVTTIKLATNAVGTDNISNDAVTVDKVASGTYDISISGNAATATTATSATSATTATTANAVAWSGITGKPSTLSGYGITDGVHANYISGLTLSTAGSSATFTVGNGYASSSDNTQILSLASPLNKTTSAWAVGTGNGALDTGAIAINTWYHVYLILRSDSGVVDVLISTSASSPTMPANYTHRRRIGSIYTNASSQWASFIQVGNTFQWVSPVLDINASAVSGTTAVTRSLSVPLGIKVEAFGNVLIDANVAAATATLHISDLSTTDAAPSTSASPLALITTQPSGLPASAPWRCITDTSRQIRTRCACTSNVTALRITTAGWIDLRGAQG